MRTSIVMLTHNQLAVTKLCIDSIRKYTNPNSYELIIVDNASTDGTVDWLEKQHDIRKIYNQSNFGFPAGCNQGIRIATGDNIMLLNNDVVVTEGWLNNLITCLYSREDIGAVGPVTNRCAYYQTIPVSYQDLDEMQLFAKNHNHSNSALWEERLKLIGYAFLFKRKIYEQVGELDEIFTPGNFEDDDFSFRIRNTGYKLVLCKDTFIHHFGSVSFKERPVEYQKLLKDNEAKFIQKWKFDSQSSTIIRHELLSQIHHEKMDSFSLLEIGCGSGGTLLQIKNNYPHSSLFGYDSNPYSIEQAATFSSVDSGTWEDISEKWSAERFDYIVINNVIEKVADPVSFLNKAQSLLRQDGSLLLVCKNLTHIRVIEQLVKGESPFARSEIRYYTLKELASMIETVGYSQLEYSAQPTWIGKAEQDVLNAVSTFAEPEIQPYHQAFEFVIKATKQKEFIPFKDIIREIDNDENVEVHLQNLRRMGSDKVIEHLVSEAEGITSQLNMLAVKNFEYGIYDDVIPYLQKSFELDGRNQDTLHNLIVVMESFGEKELAERYEGLLSSISSEGSGGLPVKWDRQILKFMLRRIECEVEVDEAIEEVLKQLLENNLSAEEIMEVVDQDCIHKVATLNLLAVLCFENELHELVIPLLQAAYEINRLDQHTLFNLGYVLYVFGERDMALSFMEQIVQPDEATQELIAAIKGA